VSPDRRLALATRLLPWYTRGVRHAAAGNPPDPAAFQRRREVNVERLNGVGRLVAMSNRVAELYAQLGVDLSRLHTAQLTLAHIERLRPRVYEDNGTVTFATLGGGESEAKGSRLLFDAIRSLSDHTEAGRARLIVFGFSNPDVREEVSRISGVELAGPYRPDELDRRLDEVDVGIMPSIWEEAYGYAGVEFLSKGIPVIANAIGGMVDYVREGETGWLNHRRDAEGLAAIMRAIVEQPAQIGVLNRKLMEAHDSIVAPLASHAEEMDQLYRGVIEEAG
jgi:glycosyltransferase involved in cell wall biosynthesis